MSFRRVGIGAGTLGGGVVEFLGDELDVGEEGWTRIVTEMDLGHFSW